MGKVRAKNLVLLGITMGLLTACGLHNSSNTNTSESIKDSSSSSIENSSVSNFISSSSFTSSASSSASTSSSAISSSSQTPSSSSNSSTPSSSASSSLDDKEYVGWDINKTLRGVAFRDDLARLINKKGVKTTSYNSMISVGAKAAAYKNTGKFIPFYHGEECLATQNQCNREHTWPNSRGGGNVEDDPFVIRPTLSSENSDRSNYFYGLNGKASLEWDPASCGFTPARGEAARVIFYIACRYGKTYKFYLTNNPSDDWNKVKTMGRLDRMYEWNQMYPPTENEIQINNYLESQGYGRNPFVDYPELVNYIWDKNGYVTDSDSYQYINSGLSYSTLVEKCSILPNYLERN